MAQESDDSTLWIASAVAAAAAAYFLWWKPKQDAMAAAQPAGGGNALNAASGSTFVCPPGAPNVSTKVMTEPYASQLTAAVKAFTTANPSMSPTDRMNAIATALNNCGLTVAAAEISQLAQFAASMPPPGNLTMPAPSGGGSAGALPWQPRMMRDQFGRWVVQYG